VSQGSPASAGTARPRLLILGGTTEASRLAAGVAEGGGLDALLSYAGRTAAPKAQPVPHRVGGFGGVEGLAAFLRRERIARVIDATHPFAARMSANAIVACAETATPLLALERPPWTPGPGDDWRDAADLDAAAATLAAAAPTTVFLAVGRLHLDAFAAAPQHRYLLRLVDPPAGPLPLPRTEVVVARGPFRADDDAALLRGKGVGLVVAKNAGGDGAEAKLFAARALGLPVVMVARPPIPPRPAVATVEAALAWLDHGADRGV
jgi:precorrin-6A/cobalt-precorrin-6A reductase